MGSGYSRGGPATPSTPNLALDQPSRGREPALRRLLVWLGWMLAIATALAVFLSFQLYINRLSNKYPNIGYVPLLKLSLAIYWLHGVFALGVFRLTRRYPFTRDGWLRALPYQLAGMAVYIVGYPLLRVLVYPPRLMDTGGVQPRTVEVAVNFVRQNVFENFWMWATVLAVAHAIEYYRRFREREMREAVLKARVAEYELQVLKMQLHPHFLFNTLHAISTLMSRDVKAARRMMVRLSDLLRIALAHASTQEVTVKEELEFLEAYVDIERTRFGERLEVHYDIEPATLDACIPNLILQPLVENAVKHGIAARQQGGRIAVRAERRNGRLRFEITNDGPPPGQTSTATRSGVGLVNTEARLQQLYGSEHHLQLQHLPGGEVSVTLELPFHLEPTNHLHAGEANG